VQIDSRSYDKMHARIDRNHPNNAMCW